MTDKEQTQFDRMKTDLAKAEKEVKRLKGELHVERERRQAYDATNEVRQMHVYANAMAEIPDVDAVILQHEELFWPEDTGIADGAGGTLKDHKRTTGYRLFVRHRTGKHCDRTKPTIGAAIAEVFADLNLDIPEVISQ